MDILIRQTNLPTLDDTALMLACRQGDSNAWAALVARYQKLIYAIPRSAGLDDEQCATVFHQTFQSLFAHLHWIDPPQQVRTWLIMTARQATEQMQQRNAHRQPLPSISATKDAEAPIQAWVESTRLPDAVIGQLEEQHLVRTALGSMEDRCRQLLTLLFSDPDQPSSTEIATRLGIPPGSIEPARNHCLQKLRLLLQDPDFSALFTS